MKNRNKSFNGQKTAGWILIGIGVLFLCVTFFVNVQPHLSRQLVQTEAEITDVIFLGYDEDRTAHYSTVVRYTVDGREYTNELSYHNSSKNPGDFIKIYYDAAQPEYTMASTPVLTVVFALAGTALTVGGVCMLASQGRRKKKAAYLKENGRRVSAEVVSVMLNTRVEVNGSNPFVVTCACSDPFTGACTKYTSKNIWQEPDLMPGDTVYVYVDRDDPEKYFVDV